MCENSTAHSGCSRKTELTAEQVTCVTKMSVSASHTGICKPKRVQPESVRVSKDVTPTTLCNDTVIRVGCLQAERAEGRTRMSDSSEAIHLILTHHI